MVLTVAVDALIAYELPDKAVQPLMVILPLLTDGERERFNGQNILYGGCCGGGSNALIIGRTAAVLSRAAYACACGFFL